MSHIPLLARHAPPPRLQPPRRAPLVCCCLLLLVVVLLVAQPPLYSYAYNATHAVERSAPPPAELHRLLEAGKWEDAANNLGGTQTPDGSVTASHLHDLLVTVRYLAKRALESR
tara:strand:+ start:724 stop:1065 length:342 start_codon:yes stop_codon:yes gene_type:complete